jgi:hypothetical protein
VADRQDRVGKFGSMIVVVVVAAAAGMELDRCVDCMKDGYGQDMMMGRGLPLGRLQDEETELLREREKKGGQGGSRREKDGRSNVSGGRGLGWASIKGGGEMGEDRIRNIIT